jgi:hypothetical protein
LPDGDVQIAAVGTSDFGASLSSLGFSLSAGSVAPTAVNSPAAAPSIATAAINGVSSTQAQQLAAVALSQTGAGSCAALFAADSFANESADQIGSLKVDQTLLTAFDVRALQSAQGVDRATQSAAQTSLFAPSIPAAQSSLVEALFGDESGSDYWEFEFAPQGAIEMRDVADSAAPWVGLVAAAALATGYLQSREARSHEPLDGHLRGQLRIGRPSVG